jgi:hypothetical protein
MKQGLFLIPYAPVVLTPTRSRAATIRRSGRVGRSGEGAEPPGCSAGRTKNPTFMQQPPAQRSDSTMRATAISFQKAATFPPGNGYFFFLEVFFAIFLVAAFALFFAFFAFLAMWSSNAGSMNMRAPCIDMRTIKSISGMQD